jgi:aminoglycoside phosphotransferase family enzyme
VLADQLLTEEPLADDEVPRVVVWDGERPVSTLRASPAWSRLVTLTGDPEATRAGPEQPGIPATQEAVVEFLSRPSSHADAGGQVEVVETHWSWVFVTADRAIKIKKAIRTEFADLRRVTARRRNCVEEVRLNRRLSHDVYLGTRPLLADAGGTIAFSTGVQAVDWAVEMRRLAPERMLDRLIANGAVNPEDLAGLVARLVAFYRDAREHDADVGAYRERLVGCVHANRDELTRPEYGLPVARIERICARHLDVLAAHRWLDERRHALVEGHGDLRPEHVCLDGAPQVIDCLDFSRALRTQDAVDDLGFLALECARLGAPSLAASILDGYRRASGDAVPPGVVRFYQSLRACVRARLAILHLREPALARNPVWRERADAYLGIAQALVEDGGMP